jgi:hypothetical protein
MRHSTWKGPNISVRKPYHFLLRKWYFHLSPNTLVFTPYAPICLYFCPSSYNLSVLFLVLSPFVSFSSSPFKGTVQRDFHSVFWHLWIGSGLNKNRPGFNIFSGSPLFWIKENFLLTVKEKPFWKNVIFGKFLYFGKFLQICDKSSDSSEVL